MTDPPCWSQTELQQQLSIAIEFFRRERMEEPLEDYLDAFGLYRSSVEELLERSGDLGGLGTAAVDILVDPKLLHAFRYLPDHRSPPTTSGPLRKPLP